MDFPPHTLALALFTGFLVGVLFSFLRLPLPAPPMLPGVLGIVGIYLGGVAYQWAISKWFA